VCVDAQGDVEVGVSGNPLNGVRWCLEFAGAGSPRCAFGDLSVAVFDQAGPTRARTRRRCIRLCAHSRSAPWARRAASARHEGPAVGVP
jgi:hypothetical protein